MPWKGNFTNFRHLKIKSKFFLKRKKTLRGDRRIVTIQPSIFRVDKPTSAPLSPTQFCAGAALLSKKAANLWPKQTLL